MRVLIDACVLFPTVLREVVLGAAEQGVFEPRWSDRILEEWARATVKLGAGAEDIARGEGALLRVRFPNVVVPATSDAESRLWLPDRNDIHVLASAIAGHCDAILTFNAADFPRDILSDHGLVRLDPDGFLFDLLQKHPSAIRQAAEKVRAEAERLSGEPWEMRKLLKKARLNRLARALS